MRRSVALLLALALGLSGRAGPAPGVAAAQEADALAPVIGRFERVIGTAITLDRGTYTATDEVARDLTVKVAAGIIRTGDWVKLTFQTDGRVISIEPSAPPAPAADPAVEARVARLLGEMGKLKPGDRIRVNGIEATFDRVAGKDLLYKPAGQESIRVLAIREITDFAAIGRVRPGDAESGRPGEAADPGDVRFGQWYRVRTRDGQEWTGYVLKTPEKDRFWLELQAGGSREIARADVASIVFAEQPKLGGPKDPDPTSSGEPAVEEDRRIEVAAAPPVLDWTANVARVRGTVRHAIPGALVAGARVEVAFRGEGTLVRPAQEDLIVEAEEAQLRGATTRKFMHQNVQHFYERGPAGAVVAVASPRETERRVAAIGEAIFPEIPEEFGVETRLFQAQMTGKRLIYDKARDVIPFADERAIPHLVEAYGRREEVRIAALRAMSDNGSPKLLPFLLLELYGDPGPMADLLKRAIILFHGKAEDWLIGLLKDRGWEGELLVPNAEGGMDRAPPRTDRDKLLALILELLQHLGGHRANQHALPHVRAENELVREAAFRLFTERHEDVLPWLIRRITGPASADVRLVLRAIEKRHPETLVAWMSAQKDYDRTFEAKLLGLDPEDVIDRRLAWIAEYRKKLADMGLEEDEAANARRRLAQLESGELQTTLLKGELAQAFAKAAGGEAGAAPRQERMGLLARAIALDPSNEEARRGLALAYVEVARELAQGVFLRTGPGEAWLPKRPLKKGEVLRPVPPPPGAFAVAGWHYARAADETVGYVNASVLIEGATGTLVAVRERRSPEDRRRILLLARAFHPGKFEEAELGLAAVAADEAAERAAAGDWQGAYERLQAAEGLAPGHHRPALAMAYLRNNPLVAIVGFVGLIVFAAALLASVRPGGAPAPATAAPAAGGAPAGDGKEAIARAPEQGAPAAAEK